ncbi:MAG: hypothetical protein ACYTE8_12095, partial [Planctomycetota bacterium]
MYKRLIPVSIIILLALCGLAALGYHSIRIWAQGLQGFRLGEFAAVAEQIQLDVKRKLDNFLLAEQQRPYTHYQYYYIPENIADNQRQQQVQQTPTLRSPLAETLENSFAYGYFQIQQDGSIVTPYDRDQTSQTVSKKIRDKDFTAQTQYHYQNIGDNLLPAITSASGTLEPQSSRSIVARETKEKQVSLKAAPQTEAYDIDYSLEQTQEKENIQQPAG